MWTLDKLREVVSDRGEMVSDALTVGRVLLAHERLRGRTEEDYPRDKAKFELGVLLETAVAPLPPAHSREYPGLKQLRSYAADRGLARAAEKSKPVERGRQAPVAASPAVSVAVREYTRAKDSDRDQG
ncbi:hypothetical protein [Hyphomicrobium sp.]|uniref:hypothetical protein n=1 Tax=Hyphomicrobium sp. TaxID=82 RepID=UPI002E367C29|nr:hypothetical protein [Hyphomicrobium sp.]HEX2842151.1 hypothetical protein [Hyphomicrobium sp.]